MCHLTNVQVSGYNMFVFARRDEHLQLLCAELSECRHNLKGAYKRMSSRRQRGRHRMWRLHVALAIQRMPVCAFCNERNHAVIVKESVLRYTFGLSRTCRAFTLHVMYIYTSCCPRLPSTNQCLGNAFTASFSAGLRTHQAATTPRQRLDL